MQVKTNSKWKGRKILVIGSGPIVIGQAAEFDYSGTQCCRALKEEGAIVVLVNSNPATIQTDFEFADRIYVEPLTKETMEKIIKIEKPDAMIATMAGQTGLNLAMQLGEVIEKYKIDLLGTSLKTIELAEDREKFAELMRDIGEPIPRSERATTIAEASKALAKIGIPLIVRPDFALGGSGSGIVRNEADFLPFVERALNLSGTHSCLIEQSVEGMSELEYEVIRDVNDNCITVCNMENLDAMGVHTGESIVVAPSQTLTDREYHMLRKVAIKVVRALDVRGACNIQFALDQRTGDYFIIEVNPRTSRSSALASKATGYPIARVATKIALGYALNEIENKITGKSAAFEPALDYCVVKIPKWPFDKLYASRALGTQMKSTGEVMAIGRNFEEALQKAVHSLELKQRIEFNFDEEGEVERCLLPNEWRLFAIKDILRRGLLTAGEISRITKINTWFIDKIRNIVEMEDRIKSLNISDQGTHSAFLAAKRLGFSDNQISHLASLSTDSISFIREKNLISANFKMVDTCASEFEAITPYYYSSYEPEDESQLAGIAPKKEKKVIILGSGPIRIGQGIEFDYATVHAVISLKDLGYSSIIINNNPETVSTDFDISSKLYFEPLSAENVMSIIEKEGDIEGVVIQFGGQTAVNLSLPLHQNGIKILGTPVSSIDASQNRKKFKGMMQRLRIPLVESGIAYTREEAIEVARSISYPLLIRPSFVLGGRAMEVVYDEAHLLLKIDEAIFISGNHAIIMDRFLEDAIEVDVDALSDSKNVKICGIMEQIEEAGIHSGDSSCVIPAIRIPAIALKKIREFTRKICLELGIIGLANIQMAVKGDEVYVLEVNPRASRTVPYLSKATGVQIAKIAAALHVGKKLADYFDDFEKELCPKHGYFAVKVPVFPFIKFPDVDPVLGPEMKSTGEVMGIAKTFGEAYLKAQLAAGSTFGNSVFLGSCGKWKKILSQAYSRAGIKVYSSDKIPPSEMLKLIKQNKISFVVDGMKVQGNNKGEAGSTAEARKAAVQKKIPVISSYFAALRIAEALLSMKNQKDAFRPIALNELL
ncbi:MAG TPA: carbamoyl-phosphate synthase large subunit [Candidatus Norongarragalinales archaeon]|nr:carbamoyl-phosphate synthase large subunit [Candidatus Norongarragalinales archaeon]